jgi:hypothetical protein
MRISSRVGIVSIVLTASILGAIAGHAASAPAPAPAPASFAQQRLEVSQRAVDLGRELYSRGLTSDLPELATWSRRLMEAKRDLGTSDAERDGAMQEYVTRMKELESLAVNRFKTGLGTEYDTLAARFMRLEAEEMAAGKR